MKLSALALGAALLTGAAHAETICLDRYQRLDDVRYPQPTIQLLCHVEPSWPHATRTRQDRALAESADHYFVRFCRVLYDRAQMPSDYDAPCHR